VDCHRSLDTKDWNRGLNGARGEIAGKRNRQKITASEQGKPPRKDSSRDFGRTKIGRKPYQRKLRNKPDRIVRFCPYERYSKTSGLARIIFINRSFLARDAQQYQDGEHVRVPLALPSKFTSVEGCINRQARRSKTGSNEQRLKINCRLE
jgi:hypothetical protein